MSDTEKIVAEYALKRRRAKQRERYWREHEKILKQQREYRRTHREVVSAAKKKWQDENKEKVREYQQAYYKKHRYEILERKRLRRVEKREEKERLANEFV